MKKTVKALLAMVMAAILVFSAIPVSAASVSENYNKVVNYINTAGEQLDGYDGKVVYYVTELDGIPAVYMLINSLQASFWKNPIITWTQNLVLVG